MQHILKIESDDFFEDWESEKSSNGGAYQDANIIGSYCNHLDIDINLYEKYFKIYLMISFLMSKYLQSIKKLTKIVQK